jgi:AcrR family transcriptional regulator
VDEAILGAALALFREGGLANATFERIARESGVGRSSIYRRWHDRDAIIYAALVRLRHAADAALPDWHDRPLTEILATFERQLVDVALRPDSLALLRQVVALGPEGAAIKRLYWQEIVLPRRAALSSIISAARSRGELPPGPDPDLLQDQLSGALLYRLLLAETPKPAAMRSYVRALLEATGLKARP